MPRRPDLPCAICGKLLWRSATSLPKGQATCLPCRRSRHADEPAPWDTELRFCLTCQRPFDAMRKTQVYCTPECRPNGSGPKASSAQRGYGSKHRAERKRWASIVDQGEALCALCHEEIEPGEAWDLDHDPGTNNYRGPAHKRCNRSDGASRGNRNRGQARAQRRPDPTRRRVL